MAKAVGVRGGLSIDHLVVAGAGCRFDELGGPGLYGALGAHLVDGADVRLCADLPSDDPRFAELFGAQGVDTEDSTMRESVPRVWILNSAQGRRIVETAPPNGVELEDGQGGEHAEPGDGAVQAPNRFYAKLDGLLESSPEDRPPTSPSTVVGIDPHQLPLRREGEAYLRRVAPENAVILPSRMQLELLGPDPRAAARELVAALGRPVVARLDRDGIYVASADGQWSITDDDVRVVETTGAGDASAGAIVAALALGADLVTAAMFGASVARLVLSDWGHAGLLGVPRLAAPYNRIRSAKEE